MKRTVMAVVLLALAAAGCGDKENKDGKASSDTKETPASSSPAKSASSAATDDKEKPPVNTGKDGKENVELAEAYAKDVCECKNAQCINKAGEKYREATDKMYADKQVRTPTPEQKKQMDDASARVKDCTDKLLKK